MANLRINLPEIFGRHNNYAPIYLLSREINGSLYEDGGYGPVIDLSTSPDSQNVIVVDDLPSPASEATAPLPPPPPPDPPIEQEEQTVVPCTDPPGSPWPPCVAGEWLKEMRAAGIPDKDLPLYWGQIHAESRGEAEAVSPVGAAGIAQAMPRTAAEEYPRTEPSCEGVPRKGVGCSARFQAHYMERVESWLPPNARTTENTLAAYNYGIGSVRKKLAACSLAPGCSPTHWPSVQKMMPEETKRYVSVIADYSKRAGFTASGQFSLEF